MTAEESTSNERSHASGDELAQNNDVIKSEDSLKDALQSLTHAFSGTSTREQVSSLSAVGRVLKRTDEVPEGVFRGLSRLIVSCLSLRSMQRDTLKALHSLIAILDTKGHILVLKYFSEAISSSLKLHPAPTKSISKNVVSLACIYADVLHGEVQDESILKNVVHALSNLGFYLLVSIPIPTYFRKKASQFVKTQNFSNLVSNVNLLCESSMDAALSGAALLSLLEPSQCPDQFLNLFCKGVLMAKTLPPHHLISGSSFYIKCLTRPKFDEIILPTLKKALLRSPEVALYGTSVLLSSITFSIDDVVKDLLKSIVVVSVSTCDDVRLESLGAIEGLCLHAGVDVMTLVWNSLLSQETACKSPEQKADIVACIGRIHSQAVPHGDLLDKTLISTITTLSKTTNEVNECVIRAHWQAVCSLSKEVSDTSKLSFLFKDVTKLSGVSRYCAFRAIASIATQKGLTALPDGSEKILMSDLEKSQKEPLENVPLSLLLLSTCDGTSSQFKSIVKSVADNEGIVKDKNLGALRSEDALILSQLIERIATTNVESVTPSLYRAFCVCLTWKDHDVRSSCLDCLTRIISSPCASLFAASLTRQLFECIESGWLDQTACRTWKNEDVSISGQMIICILNRLLTPSCDYTLLSAPSLLLSAIPRIAQEDAAIWLRWFHSHEKAKEAKEWISSSEVTSVFVKNVFQCSDRRVRNDALSMLVSAGSEPLKTALWNEIEEAFEEVDGHELEKMTEREVSIWRSPKGTLFNTHVLDFDETADAKNVKRENKAYKFKEQLAELELQRELAEKRRKEGKLTPKQKEAMEKELAKEKIIRERLEELYNCTERALSQLSAMVEADGNGALHRPHLLQRIIPLLQSHLMCREAGSSFISIVHAAFNDPDDALYDLVAYTSLRVLRSKWIDCRWTEEGGESQLKRLLTLVLERSFVVETGDDTEEDVALLYEDCLGAPQIGVLNPLVTNILQSDKYSDTVKQHVLDVLKNAMNRRLLTDDAILSLPLVQMSSLLLQFASSSTVTSLVNDAITALEKLICLVNDTSKVTPCVTNSVVECLKYVTHERSDIRESALKILSAPQLVSRVAVLSANPEIAVLLKCRLLIARFDTIESVCNEATLLWFQSLFSSKEDLFDPLFREIASEKSLVRESACRAIALFLEELPSLIPKAITRLNEMYTELRELKGVVIDEVGRVTEEAVDRWEKRLGVANCALVVADMAEKTDAMALIDMIVPDGLNDRTEAIRDTMTAVAVKVVSRHGRSIVEGLLPVLEERITKLPDGKAHDNERQGLVVVLGTLARYVDDGVKVRVIVGRLVEALSTPSQKVQEAVSSCLSPLVPSVENSLQLLATMQTVLFEGSSYGQRRGAAYGMAGIVKGLGIPSVREHNLIQNVESALMDKTAQRKQGALLALEMLSSTVGKLFEPYLVKCLPGLLLCFGDSEESVRSAARDAAQSSMRSLTSHGIKCILPKVLDALDNDSWRTKCAAVDLLGAMAFCAPRQLSSCLPKIVPKLIEVLADSHVKVRGAGERALRMIGSVIQNPEILGVATQIMQGLIDPATKTSFSLNTIVNTKFIHYMDAASLSLIMPIVRRAFEDRNSETRRLAAQIISNIYKLSEDKDMEPYLFHLVPGLQKALMDPVPEIRSVAAKALGAVVSKSTGETNVTLRTTIIPWLKQKLMSEQSTVDRSGAAQGLAEVLGAVGTEQLDYVMPEIIEATESTEVSAETRDGYILMYIYLPMVFGDKFTTYLPRVIPSILRALADENEYVRASALKAGQRLISQFVSQARRLLLPQLQAALADDNWRIRHAGVTLIGDFLFNISGITGKSTSSTSNEDDTMGMEQAGKTIVRALGQKCRDEVLAGIYLSRSDVALMVRQGANHIWKMVVSNTPRTLKEMMKTLFEKVLESLASSCEERQQTAARCLGELVRKMGEKIILEVLPVLDEYLECDEVEKRVGVAVALHEIMANMSKEVLQHYMSQMVLPMRTALCDGDESVRESAAETFHVFYNAVGMDAYDEVIGPLLEKVTNEKDNTLEGLTAVMQKNSRTMLPYVLPRLTKKPVKINALCALAAASGDSLGRQLSRILDSLLAASQQNDQYEPMIEPCEEVVLSVTDEEGVSILIDYVIQKAKEGNVPSAVLLHTFVEKTTAELEDYTDEIIQGCMQLYSSTNEQIADHAVLALLAYCKRMDTQQQMETIPLVRKMIGNLSINSKGKQLLGFAHPKGLNALVAILREGVLQGSVDTKATSSEALGVIVSLSTPEAVKGHVINMTGPLIRVLGDRFPPNVKGAILSCLSQLLDKVSSLLRPFLPQLQSTFLKSLQDATSRPVRLASAGALSRLVRLSPKPEPVLIEMLKTIAGSADKHLLETTLVAARSVVSNSSPNSISATVLQDGLKATRVCISGESNSELEESITCTAGALAGEMALRLGEDAIKGIVNDVTTVSSLREKTWAAYAMQQITSSSPSSISSFKSTLQSTLQSEAPIACAAVRSTAYLLIHEGSSMDSSLLSSLSRAINHPSVDVRKVVGIALCNVLSSLENPLDCTLLKTIVPQLVNGSKESNSTVRCASELALVYGLQLQKGQELYEEYLKGCEGAAKNVLMEVQRSLVRVVRSGDLSFDSLNNILSAP